jgi:hypothetical protein
MSTNTERFPNLSTQGNEQCAPRTVQIGRRIRPAAQRPRHTQSEHVNATWSISSLVLRRTRLKIPSSYQSHRFVTRVPYPMPDAKQ